MDTSSIVLKGAKTKLAVFKCIIKVIGKKTKKRLCFKVKNKVVVLSSFVNSKDLSENWLLAIGFCLLV